MKVTNRWCKKERAKKPIMLKAKGSKITMD